jgi:hypothetical protein
MKEERPSTRTIPASGRLPTLPQPVLRRLGRLVDQGLKARGPLSLQLAYVGA